MKTCVFFNTLLAQERLLNPSYLQPLELTADDLDDLSEEVGDYRLVVSFSNRTSMKEYEHFKDCHATACVDEWHITIGFRRVTDSSGLKSWLPNGVSNAVHLIEGEFGLGGKYTLSGPGAGYEPTTSAMLNDFAELCR